MREFLCRHLRRGACLLAMLAGGTASAAVSYEFSFHAQFKDKVPLPANTFADQPDAIPMYGVFDAANSPLGQTFHATLTLASALPANHSLGTFGYGQVLGFSAQIGDEVWGADSFLTPGAGYATDAAGKLTQVIFDFRNANGNGISVWVDAKTSLWMTTQFHFAGYDEPWERGMCAVGSNYVFSGTCFGGAEVDWALAVPDDDSTTGPGGSDPGHEVPEPGGAALLGAALASALWAGRRRGLR